MKIGVVSPWATRCGIFTYTRDLVHALADLGVNSYIVRLHRLGMKKQEYYEHLASRRIPRGLDLIHVEHEYGLYMGFERVFYALARDIHKKPIITTSHATGWRQDIDEVVGGLSDLVIVHNKFCKEQFASKKEPVIIPHGVAPREPMPSEEAKRRLGLKGPTVGVFGFQAPNKRIEDFLLACKELPDVTPVVVGGFLADVETSYMRSLKQMSGDRVCWLGYVPDEEMPKVMGALNCCCHTSSYVSESGAILTMLGYGKAVVARNLPPNKEKPCLELFEDVSDLSSKIRHLIDNPDEREALEEKARKYAQENSWAHVAQQHLNYYRQVVKR